jgi:hypothetical protein
MEVPNRLINYENIVPSREELDIFQATHDSANAQFASSEDEWDKLPDQTLKATICHMFHDKLITEDKVRVLAGEAKGLTGVIKGFSDKRKNVFVHCD